MKKNDRYVYPAVFTYEDNQISITFPDFLGCVSCADTEEEALYQAKEALGGHIWCIEQDNDAIPKATPLPQVALEENEQTVLIDVFMPAVRLQQTNKAVNRTVTLPAWLNALALEKGINFSQLLQSAIARELGI